MQTVAPLNRLPNRQQASILLDHSERPPEPTRLERFARSVPGRLVSGSTAKIAAGTLVGLGLLLLPSGLGAGLLGLGLMLWCVATYLTCVAREDDNVAAMMGDVMLSFGAGVVGVFTGMFGVGAIVGSAATGPLLNLVAGAVNPTVRAAIGFAVLALAVMKDWVSTILRNQQALLHPRQGRLAQGYVQLPDLNPGLNQELRFVPSDPRVRHNITAKLREIFGTERYSITIDHTSGRIKKKIRLDLAPGDNGGRDSISYESIHESQKEWIALANNPEKTIYKLYECTSIYNDDVIWHPETRARLTEDMVIRGQNLLDLLNRTYRAT